MNTSLRKKIIIFGTILIIASAALGVLFRIEGSIEPELIHQAFLKMLTIIACGSLLLAAGASLGGLGAPEKHPVKRPARRK